MKKFFSTSKQSVHLYLAICLAGAACSKFNDKKEESNDTGFKDKKWIIDKAQVSPALDLDGDGQKETDIKSTYNECDLDDYTVYKGDGNMVNNTGSIKCEANEPQEEITGIWSYNESTHKLTMTETGEDPAIMDVVSSTSNQLFLSYPITQADGTVYTITITFKKY
ncbi:hypothetical protein SAMN05216436_10788 [bacterium A37T11]|nr:hypothetical protein SAMN05216436_10788 [bacterium A37T11]